MTNTLAKLQFRRGTAAEWASIDPILSEGEPGVATDAGILKVGDGTKKWSELQGFLFGISVNAGDVDSLAGISGNVQDQLDGKQPIDPTLTSLSGQAVALASVLGIAPAVTDVHAITASGRYRAATDATNTPIAGQAFLIEAAMSAADRGVLVARLLAVATPREWRKARTGVGWGAWIEVAPSLEQSVWNAGTDTTEAAISPAKLDAKIVAARDAQALGWGQAWQNVSASRSADTTYQNTSGRPIMVSVVLPNTAGRFLQVSTNGSTWLTVAYPPDSAETIVPQGHYYRVTGGYSSNTWMELR